MKRFLRGAGAAAFWLAVWEGIYLLVGKAVLVPSPLSVVLKIAELCAEKAFWLSVLTSLSRVVLGFLLGTALGMLFAVLTAKSPVLKSLLSPLLHTVKATPVASFIILAVIWLSVGKVPVLTALLVVLPGVWANVESGILSVDPKLIEMGKAFKMTKRDIFFKIEIPSIKPFFLAAVNSAMGMAWKAGIAAEVICPYKYSIGTALHDSKIYLETTELFAWTAVTVILSVLLEKLVLSVVRKGGGSRAQV